MNIAIGCDHIVTDIKIELVDYLKAQGHQVLDMGTYDFTRTHYPIYGKKVANAVATKQADYGITLCGTGVGITTAAVKNAGIRAVLVRDVASAKYARSELNANIIGFGGMIVGKNLAKEIIDSFLNTPYSPVDEQKEIILKLAALDNIRQEKSSFSPEKLFAEELEKWEQGMYTD